MSISAAIRDFWPNQLERASIKADVVRFLGVGRYLAEKQYLGQHVLDVCVRGYMAETYVLKRVGEVIDVKTYGELWPDGHGMSPDALFAICTTVKLRSDLPEETWTVCLDDACLRRCAGTSAYLWSH